MKPNPIGFVAELLGAKGTIKNSKAKFNWEHELARPKNDSAQPPSNLNDVVTKKSKPAKIEELPRTQTGQIDLAEIRQNLTDELRAGRKRRS